MLAHPLNPRLINADLDTGGRVRDQNEPAKPDCFPLCESHPHVIDTTNPGRALDDGVEDRCTSVGERLMMLSTSAVAV